MKGRKTIPVVSLERPPPMFPIVGIGTSAGGLEALELFLSHVPKDCGIAFVVVQQLSPNHAGKGSVAAIK